MDSRITGHGEVAPGDLIANAANWRLHSDYQRDVLTGVMNEVGWVQEVIVNQRTGNIIDGHLRVDIARERGENVPVLYVDVSQADEKKILATLDPIAGLAETDKDQLSNLLDEISTQDENILHLLETMAADNGLIPDNSEDEDGPEDDTDDPDMGEPVIQYSLVFEDEGQQQDWYSLLRHLRKEYPDAETVGERISSHVRALGVEDG